MSKTPRTDITSETFREETKVTKTHEYIKNVNVVQGEHLSGKASKMAEFTKQRWIDVLGSPIHHFGDPVD